jgi:chromosome segregation ATPase|tara:strand:+ start:313 stop:1365 length:1053 start_codon:yes stop_codon:yes gene_type:complete
MASTVTPIRAGTKASPEAVFAACDKLLAEKGEFRNEDVLAITGGGLGTVARLVKMYRAHQDVITVNKALDAEATVSLVHSLDRLLHKQVGRSELAAKEFMQKTSEELAYLSDALEDRDRALADSQEEVERLRGQLRASEEHSREQEADLDDMRRDLANTSSELELAGEELEHQRSAHAAKLEQLASHHQHELTAALEAQRREMEKEKVAALADQADSMREAQARTEEKANSELQGLKSRNEALESSLKSAEDRDRLAANEIAELKAELRFTKNQLVKNEEVISRQQEALEGARAAQAELEASIAEKLSANSEKVQSQIETFTAAAQATAAHLKELQDQLNKERRSQKNNQ